MATKPRREILIDKLVGIERVEGSYLNRLSWNLFAYHARYKAAHKLHAFHLEESFKSLALANYDDLDFALTVEEFRNVSLDYGSYVEICGIAARDAVMSAYHAQCVLNALNKAAKATKSEFASHINFTPLREGSRAFRRAFPEVVELRNALGHSGDNASKLSSMSKMDLANFVATPFLNGAVLGASMSVRYEGRHLSFKFTDEGLEAFDAACDSVTKALAGAVKFSRRRRRKSPECVSDRRP